MKPFDDSGAFRSAPEGDGLRRLAIRGAGVTVVSGGLVLAVQIIATVVLARLLTARDFGLVAMVTTFSLLLINFGLNGFTEAILQRDQIDHYLVSNLFWINVGVGVLLTIGFAFTGSVLARFYGEPRVANIAIAMSFTIFFTTLSVQHVALLKRAMRFPIVSANDILARAVAVGVSIGLGWTGWGYWALVAGNVAQSLSLAIGAWTSCRWIPALPRRVAGTASMVRFALSTYGRFIANYCTWNLDNLLVGWRFGPVSLGFYKKAYDLFALSASQLVAPLTSVAVSALSRLNRNSAEYRRYLLGALEVTAFVGMGVGAVLTLIGTDLIRVLLGPRWDESGRIFTFFGPGIGVMLLYYTHGWIHLSIGRPDRWLGWGLVEFSVTALFFLMGLRWGPVGIAVAWTMSFWVLTIPAFWYAGRPMKLGLAPIIGSAWKYALASLIAGGVSLAIRRGLASSLFWLFSQGTAPALARIAMMSSLFGASYVGAVILLHEGCAPLSRVAGLLRDMGALRRFSTSPAVTASPGIGTGAVVTTGTS
jgi:PST family polysaccharide transporter